MIRTALYRQRETRLPAILDEKAPVSFKELSQRAAALQAVLPVQKKPAAAALLLPDGPDFLAALFAVLQAGWMAFPLNPQLTPEELSNLLRRAPVPLIFTTTELLPLCQTAVKSFDQSPGIFCTDQISPLSGTSPAIRPVSSREPMLLLASSGSTGKAKLVQLSEENLDFNVITYLRHMGYQKHRDPSPRYALGTPLFGIYGQLVAFSCVVAGYPFLPMADHFSLNSLYRGAQELGLTHYDGGTLAAVLMDKTLGHTIPYDISSLCYFGFGGSGIPDGTLERLSAAFPGIRFWSGYGMTEASPLIAQPFQELPPDKLGSVGVPLPGVTVRLDTGTEYTDLPNRTGEILAKGPNVMLGYYDDEAATREILRDGWLHTGDIGYFDEDGYLYICGRKKNMILVRGFNVYPEEIEACLLRCPLVKDCMVYGAEESSGTETVCAQIVPSSPSFSAKDLHSWCDSRLADYKRPRRFEIVEHLNKTSTGKNRRVSPNTQI